MKLRLTLLTWPHTINPETIVQFKLEFGANVNLEIVPGAVEFIKRMKDHKNVPDDLRREGIRD